MPEAGEDSASTLSEYVVQSRPGALGARKNPRVTVSPCLSDHVYDASNKTVSTNRQTKTDASLILVDLLNKTGGYEPHNAPPRPSVVEKSWRREKGQVWSNFSPLLHLQRSLQHSSRVYLFCCRSEQFIDHSEIPT